MTTIVGIDVGGTFTDLYCVEENNKRTVLKVPSTPNDPSIGLLNALAATHVAPSSIDLIVHGTTIATNAIIERKGAKCALITTHGFRDVLELGRRDRPSMYGLTGEQAPLIPRDYRFEVNERLSATGEVLQSLDPDEIRELGQALARADVEAVVVAFLHAYANPLHEIVAGECLQELGANFEIVLSHEVCNEYFEFERTSTAAVQGYLQPMVASYARRLRQRLEQAAHTSDPLVMQSNGGVVPLTDVATRAAHIVRSGPAAGVAAAAEIAGLAGYANVITGDMGGTSFDVAVIVDGKPKVARTSKLDFRIVLKLPMIDVHTIGAGGGSIASLDQAGILKVGPESAGADPGPACYGYGGIRPTVTDANVVLGRIDWSSPIGISNQSELDVQAARESVGELGLALGLSLEETARAILDVVNHNMAGRTRLLSVEQGLDPRDFALVSFGGAGPLHGGAIMREVGISKMLVPPEPGVFCATGCSTADIRYDVSQTLERQVQELAEFELGQVLDQLETSGKEQLIAAGVGIENCKLSCAADMSYAGQIHTLRVAIERGWSIEQLAEAFRRAYRAEFGNVLENLPIIIISLQVVAFAPPPNRITREPEPPTARAAVAHAHRDVYFDRWVETAIYRRQDLFPGNSLQGPAIVEQSDATTVIEPDMSATVDGFGNLIVEITS
ncbi:MAG: hydantoinase/oxoprolinase family protein [Hyphomicrobiaceae bacterium]